ncbi:hypothetical protein [Hyphomicrobium sp. CS1BSMeth3]|uniref:hypothetical protein n=1 Tax=Hyphomicrobium sp. CS1BSMeth3 TaxID=1892844 RepID=UPI00093029CF|nr:hypothetical protein [Hyphomicrobium sp. CS1BSMeth3]
MTTIVRPGAAVLFMKVGTHAQETLEDIIARKSKEITDTGFAMWGYGGNTCHPRTMVQPFADEMAARKEPILLCMQAMQSNHFAEPLRATEYSPDGIEWLAVPETVNVRGSRFALVIKDLRREEHLLPLNQTRVAVGNQRGRLGSRYVQGRVDKACLEILPEPERTNQPEKDLIKIDLVAELADPYAVFLRDHR